MAPAKLQPALLAGVAIGVLSSLPIVNIANLCCCGWVLFGGALASYLMQQNHPAPIKAGDGAIVGLFAGVIGAVIFCLITVALTIALGPVEPQLLDELLRGVPNMPPEALAALRSLQTGPMLGVTLVLFLLAWLFAGTFFGMIGGLIGAVLFRKNTQTLPPPPPPVPPIPTF